MLDGKFTTVISTETIGRSKGDEQFVKYIQKWRNVKECNDNTFLFSFPKMPREEILKK